MGMSVFSALSLQWARQELREYEAQQAQRAQTNAEEVAKGLEFSILTEDERTYSDTYNLDRARAYSAAQARTRGGQDYMFAARDSDREQFGQKATVVAIAGTDDTLVRSQIHRTETEKHILQTAPGAEHGVAVYDTSTARSQQVLTSNRRMEQVAEQLYTFYAAKYRFPTDSEYQTLESRIGIRDAWGQSYAYSPATDGQKAVLSFTTPWQYTQSMNLSLKDDENKANYDQQEPTSPTNVSPTDEN